MEICNRRSLVVVFNGRSDSPGARQGDARGSPANFVSDKGKGEGHEEVTGIRISTGFVRVRRFARGGEGRGGCGLGRSCQFRQRARAAVAEQRETQPQSQGLALESPRRRPRDHADTPRAFRQAALPRDLSGPPPAERQDSDHADKPRQSPLSR